MQTVIIDASLPEKLLDLYEPVILCDSEGVVIGRFVPDTTRFVTPMLSEELQRRLAEPGRANSFRYSRGFGAASVKYTVT